MPIRASSDQYTRGVNAEVSGKGFAVGIESFELFAFFPGSFPLGMLSAHRMPSPTYDARSFFQNIPSGCQDIVSGSRTRHLRLRPERPSFYAFNRSLHRKGVLQKAKWHRPTHRFAHNLHPGWKGRTNSEDPKY